MSFSEKIKNEITGTIPNARHCRIAELAAIVCQTGELEGKELQLSTENEIIADRAISLLKKLYSGQFLGEVLKEKAGRGKFIYRLQFDREWTERIMSLIKANEQLIPGGIIYQQPCCKRAYLKGVFLSTGSVTDPEKDYHFEIISQNAAKAGIIREIFTYFQINAKTVHRKKSTVIYLKDSENISDALNIIEAHVSLMDFENIRILKDMRNNVNRRVNCEAANIGRTIAAAKRQIEDIIYLHDTTGFEGLSEELRTTAELRLAYPDSSLSELGSMHPVPIGRSGVNHRLQKLSEMAQKLRSERN